MKVHNHKYQTKQWLPQHDYNLYDFGARMYDPVLARFTTPDPLMQFNNPYLAMGANPVSMVDPTGMWSSTMINHNMVTAQEMEHAAAVASQSGSGTVGPGSAGVHFYTQAGHVIAQVQMQHGATYAHQSLNNAINLAVTNSSSTVSGGNLNPAVASGINNLIAHTNSWKHSLSQKSYLSTSNSIDANGNVGQWYKYFHYSGGEEIVSGYSFEAPNPEPQGHYGYQSGIIYSFRNPGDVWIFDKTRARWAPQNSLSLQFTKPMNNLGY
ncbi:MAG: hypothetical protein IPO27_09625 [Bacteroidetes bacterium]|nr:hypothetical protein [Bacteroidota bacterium]